VRSEKYGGEKVPPSPQRSAPSVNTDDGELNSAQMSGSVAVRGGGTAKGPFKQIQGEVQAQKE